MDNNSESIRGIVTDVIYYKEDSGYAVIVLQISGDKINVAGNMPLIYEGASILVYGNWFNHPKYGQQFNCTYYEQMPIYSSEAAYNYLSSGFIKGLGKVTAKRIVEKFGDETFQIIENDYDKLSLVKGITPKKARAIHEEYVKKSEYQNIISFFTSYKIPPEIAMKAYNAFGLMTIPIVKQNPYILWERIERISFLYVDELAGKLGFCDDSPKRVDAGIIYALNKKASLGHTCYPKTILTDEVSSLLKVEKENVENGILRLISNNRIYHKKSKEDEFIILPYYYDAENYILKRTKMLSEISYEIPKKVEKAFSNITNKFSLEQKNAVKEAIKCGITIITGGPGTGKTAIIRAITECFEIMDKKVILTAPTGRAAKQAALSADLEASTIHRLLEVTGHEDEFVTFKLNENNPLDCDVIIVDEMSMTDVILFKSLLCALKETTRVVLIGDRNQLLPVGAGNVLRDLIELSYIKCTELNKIYRQNENSLIIKNAYHILNGNEELILNDNNSDFFFLKAFFGKQAIEKVVSLVTKRLPNYLNIPPSKIQVVTPFRKSIMGSVNLNKIIKDEINPITDENFVKSGQYSYSVGDRVMQIKNDYDIKWNEDGQGIYNGDMGVITAIDKRNENLTVIFDDDKKVIYEFSKLENLELSYAITVHKSQGSEFDAVVIPFMFEAGSFTNRNLLYTAVTRAKKMVCIVGQLETVKSAIRNEKVDSRFTYLKMIGEDLCT